MRRLALLLGVWAALLVHSAQCDELRPGYLELRQTASDTYSLLFKIPALGEDLRLALYVNLPEGASDAVPPQARFGGGAYVERRTIRRGGGLARQTIAIEGLSRTSTDILVRIENLGGATQTERLSPTRTAFVVQAAPGSWEVARTYLWLGVEHILFGFDHLLFILALVILVRDWRRIAVTVTAFALAHSITLAAATLGLVTVRGPLVEIAIAFSIVLVAAEIVNARRGRSSLTARWPWGVAFCFGLLHGFGFADALAEVGLPAQAVPVAETSRAPARPTTFSVPARPMTVMWLTPASGALARRVAVFPHSNMSAPAVPATRSNVKEIIFRRMSNLLCIESTWRIGESL